MAPGGMEGPLLGTIRQTTSCCSCNDRLEVLDAHGSVIYILEAYAFQCGPNCCCREYEFKVRQSKRMAERRVLSLLTWQWARCARCADRAPGRHQHGRLHPQRVPRVQHARHVQPRGQPADRLPLHRAAGAPRRAAGRGVSSGLCVLRKEGALLRQRRRVMT